MPYGQDLNKLVRVNNENGCLNKKIYLAKYGKLAKELDKD